MFEAFTPGVAKIAQLAGESSSCTTWSTPAFHSNPWYAGRDLSRGGHCSNTRVPRGEYHLLAPALDVGAQGVMVPMVESADQARAIVEATHYPPTGRRGAAFGFAHDDFDISDVGTKIRRLDARNTVIAQVETARGLENVEEIAAVKGIDVLWVGHFDLTNFFGHTGCVFGSEVHSRYRSDRFSSPKAR